MDSMLSSKPGQNRDFQLKIFIFSSITFFIFFVLIVRTGYLQIVKNISYSTKSEKIKERTVRVPPLRGNIVSSDNEILAENSLSFNILLNYKSLAKDTKSKNEELLYLANLLNIDLNELEKKIESNKNVGEMVLVENISLDKFNKLKENIDNLFGISYEEIHYRYYPFKDTLSHVIGFTGPINRDELKLYSKDGYVMSDYIGKYGIEKQYETELRGKPGHKVYSINARMIVEREIKEKEILPEPGNELVLTIDMKFQKVVEDILSDRVGTIVVARPSNGEILALASYPDFDPNIYILNNDENRQKRREIVLNTRETPLINRAIQAVYPAASVFKTVTATAVINEKIFSPNDKYYCSGIFRVGIDTKKCWVYPAGHGSEDLLGAIKDSCDVYFYNVAPKVGPNKIKEYASLYNFGKILEIDLPSEREGIIPDPDLFKTWGRGWYDGDTMNMIIGQGEVKVTALQMINLFSIISNKGFSFKPHILKSIRSSFTGEVLKEIKPEIVVDIRNKVSNETFDFLHESLRTVVKVGTAKFAFLNNPYKIAGKTGTGEVGTGEKKDTHSWFIGFGPIDYPEDQRIVVAVLIEHDKNNFLRYAAAVANLVFYAYLEKVDFITAANKMYYPVKKSYRLEGQ